MKISCDLGEGAQSAPPGLDRVQARYVSNAVIYLCMKCECQECSVLSCPLAGGAQDAFHKWVMYQSGAEVRVITIVKMASGACLEQDYSVGDH